MSENTQIVCNQEYYVAKIFGCNEFKSVVKCIGLEVGAKITVRKINGEKVVFAVEGKKRLAELPMSYFNQITLVPADDAQCHEKIVAELDNINISLFQTAESYPTNLFFKQNSYKFENYNLNVTYLPNVDYIFGNDYQNKRFRNLILSEKNDVFVSVVDFHKLETELVPIVQLMDLGVKIVILVRGYCEEDEEGRRWDLNLLSKYLGIPIALYNEADETDESREIAIAKIVEAYAGDNADMRFVHMNYGRQIESRISSIQKTLNRERGYDFNASSRFLAVSLLEEDNIVHSFNTPCKTCNNIVNCFVNKHISFIGKQYNNHVFYILKQARRAYIDGLVSKVTDKKKIQWDAEKLDNIFMHKVLGFPIFLLIIAGIFYLSFELGKYPMNWMTNFMYSISESVSLSIGGNVFGDFLANGLIPGVGCILAFVPVLMIYFLLVGFLETSGYLSRATFSADAFMRKLGLQGKTLIPMVLGFGCAIPAIMSVRQIEGKSDRILASLMLPFLPCAARLPICILLVSAFFPKFPALIMFAIYLIGILLAIGFSKLYTKTLCKQTEFPYVIELTSYRKPTILILLIYMWNRCWEFLKRISGIVIIGVLAVWALAYFPNNDNYSKNYDALIDMAGTEEARSALHSEMAEERLENSTLAKVGKFVEPVFRPLGFDWKLSVATLSGFAGKELTISTMSILYPTGNNDEISVRESHIVNRISSENDGMNSNSVALAFVVFVIICFPCLGATSAIRKVSGFRWAMLSAGVSMVLAWLIAWGVSAIF